MTGAWTRSAVTAALAGNMDMSDAATGVEGLK